MSDSGPISSRRSSETIRSSSATPANGSSTSSTKPRRRTPRRDRSGLIANIDGGARGNPGTAGFGVYLQDIQGREVDSLYGYLGTQTNNVAEYAALLAVLRYAVEAGIPGLVVRSDSQLLVRQISGEYRVKNPTLRKLHATALSLMRRIGKVSVEHVRREQNKEADRLANEAMDTGGEQPEGIVEGLLE